MFPTIDLFGTTVDTYNTCMLLSYLIVFITALLLRPQGLPFKYVFEGMLVLGLFALMGAKALNIMLNPARYEGRNIIEILQTSGVAYLGAPILGLFALWIFCRIMKTPFLVAADFAAPFLMLDRIIGRIGCLGYGCCYGIPSRLPWAYPFTAWGIQNIVPRHPTQAYMIIYDLAIFVSSRYLYKRLNPAPDLFARSNKEVPAAGITFFYVWLCYGVLRFFNEFLRAEGPFIYEPIKHSHILTSIFAVVSLIALYIIIKKSSVKGEILKALKGAFARLAVWYVAAAVVILSVISLYNHYR